MDTKYKGDIGEQAAILHALKNGYNVLSPIGDRLPYDLVFERDGIFLRIQVKTAWFDRKKENFVVDVRRTKTNRRFMKRDSYCEEDFDFALVYLIEKDIFYVFPVNVFIGYGSEIHFVEVNKRQRKPKSAMFRDAWELLSQWAALHESACQYSVKFGEASVDGDPEPSPQGKV